MNPDDLFRREDEKVDSRWFAFVITLVALAVAAFYLHHTDQGVHAASGLAHERIVIVRDGT